MRRARGSTCPSGLPPVPPYQGEPGFFRLGQLGADARAAGAGRAAGLLRAATIAASLAADIAKAGGKVDAQDLAACRAELREAPTIDWRGTHTLHTAGGLTAAPTLAAVVKGMAGAKPAGQRPGCRLVRARCRRVMRQAYAERLEGLGAAKAASEPGDTCTTHLTVVDGEGNLVAMTTTLLSSMGSRVVLPDSGVLMNNGMMWFDPRPGSANAIAPGARPLCNMCPVIVTPKDGSWPRFAVGASGGRRILASVYQMLAWTLDFGMDVDDGRASAAHRRLRPGLDQRRSAPAGRDAGRAGERPGRSAIVEHGVLPINFACPNMIRVGRTARRACSDVISPWSAAIAAQR